MIKFQDVSFVKEQAAILKDISWQVNAGEHWAILGLNGSGKTTLLKILCGYEWPTTGHVTVLGEHFGQTSIPELRKQIGWVSSALKARIKGWETAEKIVLSGKFASIGIYERYSDDDLATAVQLLADCGGKKLIGSAYNTLSQGQQQLVLIARALMADPRVLILDEPCSGLDLFAREELLETVSRLIERPHAPTVLYVTHHTEEILPIFNSLLLLRDGKIYAQGSTGKLMNESVLNDFYPEKVRIISQGTRQYVIKA